MRSVCSAVSDMCLLLVAADEGCQRQTDECVGWLDDVRIPTVVCLNKTDIPGVDTDHVTQQVREFEILQTAPVVHISAKTGKNVDQLLQTMRSVVESSVNLRANVSGPAAGVVLEVQMQKGSGLTLEVLVTQGSLRKQDFFLSGLMHGKIRRLCDELDKEVQAVGPGRVARILVSPASKLRDLPIGESFYVCEKELAEQVVETR